MIGKTLTHFKINAKLGANGIGEVCLAEDTEPDRKIAPSRLASEDGRRHGVSERFRRAAKAVEGRPKGDIWTLREVSFVMVDGRVVKSDGAAVVE